MTTAPFPGTEPAAESWRDYWSRDSLWRESPLGRVSAGVLFRRVRKLLSFDRTDSVLEIGCGPGHLASLLAPHVDSIHAADIAPAAVAACRERCRSNGNVTVGVLGSDYTDLAGCGGPFTKIVCVSVVQYYRNVAEVERLIRSVRRVAAPGAALLIADLPVERGPAGFAWDALGTLGGALRGGYLGPLLRAAHGRWGAGSPYRAVADRAESLVFSRSAIAGLVDRAGLPATIVRGSLSIYANRPSLVFRL